MGPRAGLLGLLLVGACLPTGGGPRLPASLCGLAEQPADAPARVVMLVEIPAGGRVKYEFDRRTERLVGSRVLPDSFAYPGAYGAFPCTIGGDADPLDALLLTDIDVVPGSLVTVRPIGVLRMVDDGADDAKVIVVPLTSPLSEVPLDDQQRIERFFRTYKGPAARVEIIGWDDAANAAAIISLAIAAAVPL